MYEMEPRHDIHCISLSMHTRQASLGRLLFTVLFIRQRQSWTGLLLWKLSWGTEGVSDNITFQYTCKMVKEHGGA